MIVHFRRAVLRTTAILVGLGVLASGCSGAHQAVTATPPHGLSYTFAPSGNVSGTIYVTIPTGSPPTQSISVTVNGGSATIYNLTGCSGTPPICAFPAVAPMGTDIFKFETFSGSNGTGTEVASADDLRPITSGFTIPLTLFGTPASIDLAIKKSHPTECNPPLDQELDHMVFDILGNMIVGDYGEVVTLSDSDTTGTASLSASSITQSSDSVTLSYNGNTLRQAIISASASTVPPSAVTKAVLKPTQLIYVVATDTALSKTTVSEFPQTAKGTVTPLREFYGGAMANGVTGVAADNKCHVDVLDSITIGGKLLGNVDEFNTADNGAASPFNSFYDSTTPLSAAAISITVDGNGNFHIGQGNTFGQPAIFAYSSGASGDTSPTAVISGTLTDLSNPLLALGFSGKFYVAQPFTATANLLVFPAGSSGNTAPTQVVNAISNANFIGVDLKGNMLLGDRISNNVQYYAPNANGNASPFATLAGAATLLCHPVALAVPFSGNLFVLNQGGSCGPEGVLEFTKGASGNTPPLKFFSDPSLTGPEYWYFSPGNRS